MGTAQGRAAAAAGAKALTGVERPGKGPLWSSARGTCAMGDRSPPDECPGGLGASQRRWRPVVVDPSPPRPLPDRGPRPGRAGAVR